MTDFEFNIAKGRITEFAERINSNDPTSSAFVMVALASAGISSDATLKDLDTLSAILSSATTAEAVNVGYERKKFTNTSGITITYDDTNDRVNIDIPDQVWTAVQATGGPWVKLLICYDPDTTNNDDSEIIPCTAHDFAVTPNGSDITATIDSNGIFRSS